MTIFLSFFRVFDSFALSENSKFHHQELLGLLSPNKRYFRAVLPIICFYVAGEAETYISSAWGPPRFLKKRSENVGANENLSCGFPSIPGIARGAAPRITGFVLLRS